MPGRIPRALVTAGGRDLAGWTGEIRDRELTIDIGCIGFGGSNNLIQGAGPGTVEWGIDRAAERSLGDRGMRTCLVPDGTIRHGGGMRCCCILFSLFFFAHMLNLWDKRLTKSTVHVL